MTNADIKIYFSDFFEVDHNKLESYGALDISLLSDNPAFIDPFLIFYSKNKDYQQLHQSIVNYLIFLKKQSDEGNFSNLFYTFPEVNEVWLGFSKSGNKGLGLGPYFANELNENLINIFKGNKNKITKSTHIEKLCIIGERIGADKISDFTLNLIKHYLVKYTEKFAIENLDNKYISKFRISKLFFDFEKSNWVDGEAVLPINPHDKSNYVLLTPKDILVKEEGWISVNDFLNNDGLIISNISNDDLRYKINQYFLSLIPDKRNRNGKPEKDLSKKNTRNAMKETAKKYPELIDYFIKCKEENGQGAVEASLVDNDFLKQVFYLGIKAITKNLKIEGFYKTNIKDNSFLETIDKIKKFKYVMEKRDGYTVFWDDKKLRKFKEPDVDKMIDLVFASSDFSIDKQVNNGRGSSDIKVSKGSADCTIIETKLAKNPQLENNLQKQLNIYKEANNTTNGVYVILYFNEDEFKKVQKIFKKLGIDDCVDKWIFLIDCRKKISASKA
ncbi:MAG TPA: hypothetical protein P5230_00120 [Candidatus Magasanikbacteria bacterium]|nr:hypothetical protein [Candidatus Magasanikbacteria bacterium]